MRIESVGNVEVVGDECLEPMLADVCAFWEVPGDAHVGAAGRLLVEVLLTCYELQMIGLTLRNTVL